MEQQFWGFTKEFEVDSGKSLLVLKKDQLNNNDIISFQAEMLAKNKIPGVLELGVRDRDLQIRLCYDITGLVTLSNFFKRDKVSKAQFMTILENITSTLVNCKNYLLYDRFFIFDETMIYLRPETLQTYLVYLPLHREQNLLNSFREFVINLIINTANIDTNDNFVQVLLQKLRTEDFCLSSFQKDVISEKGRENKDYSKENLELSLISEPKDNNKINSSELKYEREKHQVKESGQFPARANYRKFYAAALGLVLLLTAALLKGNFVNINLIREFYGTAFDGAASYTWAAVAAVVGVLALLVVATLTRTNDQKSGTCPSTYQEPGDSLDLQVSLQRPNISGNSVSQRDMRGVDEAGTTDETVFLNDKGQATLVSVDGQDTIRLSKPEFIIGRNRESCDYTIDNKSVGRAHASIIMEEGKFYIVDLDSKNGTFLNGTRLISNKQYEISGNDRILFANAEFCFKLG